MTREGFSRTALDRMHETLSAHVRRGETPGLVALVSHGEEAHAEALGSGSVGGAPIRRDTIFRISSMSKPVIGATTMLLVDDGWLRLEEPVERFLPELGNRRVLRRINGPLEDTVATRRSITVRNLLTFTMGFGDLFDDPETVPVLKAANEFRLGMGPPMPAEMPPPDEWIRRLGTLPLMYQPGERWMYNTGADVLGVLIARASGKPLEAFLRERLFDPLGMKDTAFHVPATTMARFGPLYWTNYRTGKEEVYDEPRAGQWSRPPPFPSGAGGLVSTIDDYLAFARMLLNHGEHGNDRVLSARSVEAMTKDQLTSGQKSAPLVPGFFDTHGWGFCMAVLTHPDELATAAGRYGWDGGMGTSWFNDPNEDLIALLMTPRMWTSPNPPDVCRAFWAAAYETIHD